MDAQIIAVFSTKGGVGKTTTAVCLAALAAREGPTLLWDLDAQGASTYLLQVKPKLKHGVAALVEGRTGVRDLIRESPVPGLDVLPADPSYRSLAGDLDAAKKSSKRLAKVLGPVRAHYRTIVLDCPPESSTVAVAALRAADTVLVPLPPAPLSLRSLDQVAELVEDSEVPPRLVGFLSMVDRRRKAHREAQTMLPATRPEVLPITVPSSVVVERMGFERAPLSEFAPKSAAAQALQELWEAVRAPAPSE
ncbi:MAG: ParA family protein [Microbacteriaceae bacterium]|jgi:cellulose biosynthesis protein BcsQ|nr:ParA family protein [Microbacteriaceae bacterium]MCI1207016.1 ParA family protein [Microbacteriaceae bacterium]